MDKCKELESKIAILEQDTKDTKAEKAKFDRMLNNKFVSIQSQFVAINSKIEYLAKVNIPEYLRDIIGKNQIKLMKALQDKIKARAAKRDAIINEVNINKLRQLLGELDLLIIKQERIGEAGYDEFNKLYREYDRQFKLISNKSTQFKFVDWIHDDLDLYSKEANYKALLDVSIKVVGALFDMKIEEAKDNKINEQNGLAIVLQYNDAKLAMAEQFFRVNTIEASKIVGQFKNSIFIELVTEEQSQLLRKFEECKQNHNKAITQLIKIGSITNEIAHIYGEFKEAIDRLNPIVYIKSENQLKIIDVTSNIINTHSLEAVNSSAQCLSIGLKIFFIGGEVVPSTLVYESNKITKYKDMHIAKYNHGLCYWNGLIYSMGGYDNFYVNKNSERKNIFLNDFEIYNVKNDCWTKGKPLKEERRSPATFIINKMIYALGGVKIDFDYNGEEGRKGKDDTSPCTHYIERNILNSSDTEWQFIKVQNIKATSRISFYMQAFTASNDTAVICGGNNGFELVLHENEFEVKRPHSINYCSAPGLDCTNTPIYTKNSVYVTLDSDMSQYSLEKKEWKLIASKQLKTIDDYLAEITTEKKNQIQLIH